MKNFYYMFDKAFYHDFDPLQCPPWNLTDERPSAGLFPIPPRPSAFKHYTVSLNTLYASFGLLACQHCMEISGVRRSGAEVLHVFCLPARPCRLQHKYDDFCAFGMVDETLMWC